MNVSKYLQIILTIVAEECGENVEDVCSRCRRVELVRCRTMYCAAAWRLLHPTLREIGNPICRSSSTVQEMILNHSQIKDKLYASVYRRTKEIAERKIFGS